MFSKYKMPINMFGTKNKTFLNKFKYYCEHTQLHGLKHVLAGQIEYKIARYVWNISFGIYFLGMIATFVSIFYSFNKNAVNFLKETTYLEWNTTFPSVTVCQISGTDFALGGRLGIIGENDTNLELFVADILFFTGSCYSCQMQCKYCSQYNFTEVVHKLRKPCTQLLDVCKWNNIEFNCCDYFLPLDTEYGKCFSLNSLHTGPDGKLDPRFIMNRKSGTGELSLETIEDVRIYFHAPEDVPYINFDSNYRKDIIVGDTYEILFNTIEITNDENVRKTQINKRGCRYPEEKPTELKVHNFYSYSACMVQCHADNHIRLCNCTHHLMPFYNKGRYCDIEGLLCLTDNFETLNRIHARGYDKKGLVCDCLPSCLEPEYTLVSNNKILNGNTSGIKIKMQSLPTSRLKRVVVKSSLDLVVSLGGVAGLFIGASIVSIVEIIYVFLIRKF